MVWIMVFLPNEKIWVARDAREQGYESLLRTGGQGTGRWLHLLRDMVTIATGRSKLEYLRGK